MRVLPIRTNHGSCRAPRSDSAADRRANRCCDDQCLPLRHLSAHPRRSEFGGGSGIGELTMKTSAGRKADVSRRTFVIGSAAAGGGLALGFNFSDAAKSAQAQNAAEGPAEINAWVVVKPDDTCVIRIARSEMGQGTRTGLAQLVAEELECDWKKVATESITAGRNLASKRAWGEMGTGGSRGIRTSHDYVRRGGAMARLMLLQAAAEQMGVPVGELTVSNGVITHAASKRSLRYGEVAAAAAKLTPPDPKSITLKDPKDWKIAGKPVKRLDTADKLDGSK